MDKNIAALLRADARTVQVTFEAGLGTFDEIGEVPLPAKTPAPKGFSVSPAKHKTYTYVTHIPDLARGDAVIVQAGGEIKIAYVETVDEDVEIEPNSTTYFKWVIDRVDMAGHRTNMDRNAQIETEMAQAYRNNLRRSFAASVLAGLGDEHKAKLLALTGASDSLG